jgi:hypothetical protein
MAHPLSLPVNVFECTCFGPQLGEFRRRSFDSQHGRARESDSVTSFHLPENIMLSPLSPEHHGRQKSGWGFSLLALTLTLFAVTAPQLKLASSMAVREEVIWSHPGARAGFVGTRTKDFNVTCML